MKDTLNKVRAGEDRRTRTRSIALSLVIAAVGAVGTSVPPSSDQRQP